MVIKDFPHLRECLCINFFDTIGLVKHMTMHCKLCLPYIFETLKLKHYHFLKKQNNYKSLLTISKCFLTVKINFCWMQKSYSVENIDMLSLKSYWKRSVNFKASKVKTAFHKNIKGMISYNWNLMLDTFRLEIRCKCLTVRVINHWSKWH